MRFPTYIDLRPIGACNTRCSFCFGPLHHRPSMSKDRAFDIIRLLEGLGCKGIVLSGGEPTLLRYLPELVEHISSTNLYCVLSTNGTADTDIMRRILPKLTCIGLPLDSPIEHINNHLRPSSYNSYRAFFRTYSLARQEFPGVHVKVGTVVTRHNYSTLHDLPSLFADDIKPDVWKLYQMSCTNYGRDNRDDLQISEDVFIETIQRATPSAKEHGMRIVVYRNCDRDGKYLFIDPNGDAVVIHNGDELVIGNLVESLDVVLKLLPRYIDHVRLEDNFTITHRLRDE